MAHDSGFRVYRTEPHSEINAAGIVAVEFQCNDGQILKTSAAPSQKYIK